MERRTTKRAAAAVAFAATLTGGAVVGAMLGAPTTSGAQSPSTESTTTTTPDSDSGSPDRPHKGPGFFRTFDLSVAADALGLSEDELRERLDGGDTLAEVAEAEGVAVDEVIDALVAAGQEAIDEAAADAEANLEERITELVEDGFPAGGHGPGEFERGGHIFGFADLSTAAEALGLTEDELRERLRDGDSLADIADAEGVDVDGLVSALVDAASAAIDERVEAGDLDEDEAAELKDDLDERIRSFVEDGRPGPWGHRPGR